MKDNSISLPEMITKNPEIDISVEGLKSYLIQGENQQVIFMSFDKDVTIPVHSHEAQWGVVLDGEIELTNNGKKRILKKGDSYHIPKDVIHSAKIKKGYKDITVFDQKDRYKVK